jgi:oligopeptidase B
MKQFCPLSNIRNVKYPYVFVGAAMNDGRVPYWEPIKFVANLRQLSNHTRTTLLLTDLEGGHYSLWTSGQIPLRWAFLVWAISQP